MEYLLKASTVSVIFYLSYKLFLQRDTFFNASRYFLLLGLLSSFIIPFLVIPIDIEFGQLLIPNYIPEEAISTTLTSNKFNVSKYFLLIYALGVFFFIIRFIIQFVSLFSIINNNTSYKKGNYTYVETTNNISPFSFFNWIVLNYNAFNNTELNHIITHEQMHANQKHSIDILIGQLSCIALWFNPFIWFYNKDLKQNLEFIADFKTQNKFDHKSYQTTLLKTTATCNQMELSTNFYNSLIKKRIIMLHKSKSKKINLVKYALVLPLIILFLISCNSEKTNIKKVNDEQTSTWKTTVGVNALEGKREKPIIFLDGKEISNDVLESLNPETIKSMNIFKNEKAIEKHGDKGKNGVLEITTKE
ncbi:MAG: M56 family metallopeptidase [Algibacter sp.]|uniref:M56 family metallopeptidase n=1 Tax=Algibacter sp. TaxID=1872428 RepID=UPI00329878BA